MKTGEHYSHLLRSPLGIALGVLTDLVDGYQVSPDELLDAKTALLRMSEILNELRDFDRAAKEEK